MSAALELEVLDPADIEQRSFQIVGTRDVRLAKGDIVQLIVTELLTRASVIGDVSDPEQMAEAAKVLGSAKLVWNALEARRVALKKPSIEEGRAIDREIGKPMNRIKENVIDVLQKRVDAEATRQLKLRREAEEKIEIERRAAVAAANNAKAEIRQAPTEEKRDEAIQKLNHAQAAIQTATTTPVPLPTPVAGMSTGAKWVGTVVNSTEAYKHRPDFFELKTKQAVINESIRGGFRGCPGVLVEEVGKARVNV